MTRQKHNMKNKAYNLDIIGAMKSEIRVNNISGKGKNEKI